VRKQLDSRAGCDVLDASEMAVCGHAAGVLLRNERRDRVLVAPTDDALELHTPCLHAVAVKAQLAEWNAILGVPTRGIDGRCHLPDGVPRAIVHRDRLELVPLDGERVDVEPERS